LTQILLAVNNDHESKDAEGYAVKIGKILFLFSQGDHVVKTAFAKPDVLQGMFQALPTLPSDVLLLILKSIRQLAMDDTTLDSLEQAGAIPALIPYFNSPHPEVQNQVLLSMYYLCQLNQPRQEQAAASGIIPHVQRIIRANHPLKQFAFPIICSLAKTKRSRMELKKYSGVEFYIEVLKDPYWRTYALDVLSKWLNDDRFRVEFILHANLHKLFTVFKTTVEVLSLGRVLTAFYKIVHSSLRLNLALGRCPVFISELKTRLLKADEPHVRKELLNILTVIFEGHTDRIKFFRDNNLEPLLRELSQDTKIKIVSLLSRKLLAKFETESKAQAKP